MHDLILSMYHMMGLWWGILYDNLHLFIHCNLVMQGFCFGRGDAEKSNFILFVDRIFSYG